MARDIEDNANVTAAGGDYPYGRVKDQSTAGAGDGTPVTEVLLGDLTQFANRMMVVAGITPNGLPDNTPNTFQLHLALLETINARSPQVRFGGFNTLTSLTMEGAGPYYIWEPPTVKIAFDLGGSDTRDIVSFGSVMPEGTELTLFFTTGGGGLDIILNSTNAGAEPVILLNGTATANTVYTYTVNTWVKVLRVSAGWLIQEVV